MKELDSGRKIDAYIPDSTVMVLTIYGKINPKPIGSVLFCIHKNYIEVLHIYIEKPYRGQGFAKDLVRELQKRYEYIITGWAGSESAGRDLFLKCGFEVKKAMFRNRLDTLEWRKE